MPFPHSFLLDIVLMNRQNMPMDAWGCIIVSSTDSTMTKYRTDFVVLELASRHLRSIISLVFLDYRFLVLLENLADYEISIISTDLKTQLVALS